MTRGELVITFFIAADDFNTAPSSFIDMAARLSFVLLVALLLCLLSFIHSFQPLLVFDGNTTTHRDITQRAILRKTAEVCQTLAADEGRDFSLTVRWIFLCLNRA